MLRLDCVGESHPGLVRSHNKDSGFAGPYLALVADGVGGAAAGEVASATAAYVVAAMAIARPDTPHEQLLREAVGLAQQDLRAGTRDDPHRAGMATTLTGVLCDGDRFVLGHLGDSRAYRWRDGVLTALTRDHTWVQQLVDAGRLRPEQVGTHPYRSVVLRSLDAETGHRPDVTAVDLRAGDLLLVCSDGLTDYVAESEVAGILAADAGAASVRGSASRLVEAALAGGGGDNVTCVLGEVVESPRVVADGTLLGAVREVGNVVDPVAVHPASA